MKETLVQFLGWEDSPGEGIGYPLQYSWASLVAQRVKNLPAMRETWVGSLGRKIPWRRKRLPTPVFWPGEFHGLYSPWGRREADATFTFTLRHSVHTAVPGRALRTAVLSETGLSPCRMACFYSVLVPSSPKQCSFIEIFHIPCNSSVFNKRIHPSLQSVYVA